MSRVGKQPIIVPKGVTLTQENDLIVVKGPKGTLKSGGFENIRLNYSDDKTQLVVAGQAEEPNAKALSGLRRVLINNMVIGVSTGYERILELVGVGYRAEAKGKQLDLALGFSHQVTLLLPAEVEVATETVKGQNPKVILKSIDKQLLGQVAAKIRSIRPPEPYKGKGVKYSNEIIRRKAGKAAGKSKK
jgi:large subunit ribosomal protein L6